MGDELTLDAAFYDRDVVTVARELLGRSLVRSTPEGVVVLRLTEVEAYGGADDPGSHGFRGPGRRNATMFGPPGRLYVYFTYGMHFCANLVCGPEGRAAAVLLRAGEVVEGAEIARARRPGVRDRDLARGPARLTTALALTGSDDGLDTTTPGTPLHLRSARVAAAVEVLVGPRVGVSGEAAATPWRFSLRDEPTVSAYRPAVRRRRSQSRP